MKSLRMFLWMTVLTGVLYPLFITGISSLAFPHKAQGSRVMRENKIVGSLLIGQKFENEKYFWPRPSVNDYNPLPSQGSNLGPTSSKLQQIVEMRKKILAEYGRDEIPSDLLFASGSGLDPHITPQAAYFQIARVAKARNIAPERLKKLVEDSIEKRRFGLLGVWRVNVLKLNLALDEV